MYRAEMKVLVADQVRSWELVFKFHSLMHLETKRYKINVVSLEDVRINYGFIYSKPG